MSKLYYLGTDVSKEKIICYDGKEEFCFENERGLREFKRFLKKRYKSLEEVVVIFEATGVYSAFLREFCATNGIKAVMLNPRQTPNLAKVIGGRNKSDKIDARMLYRFKDIVEAEDIKVPELDKELEEICAYFSSYRLIVKERVALNNHLKALERNPFAPEELKKVLKGEISRLREQEKWFMEEMERRIRSREELETDLELLLTIEGVGMATAIVLLLLFKRYEVRNRNQVVALLGLDPVIRESGRSVRFRSRISKQGREETRAILFMAAMSGIRYNSKLKAFYERLVERGKPKKVAIIACARKLALIAFAIYKTKTAFNPTQGNDKNVKNNAGRKK